MAKRTDKIGATAQIGKVKLSDKDIYLDGVYEDTICVIKIGRKEGGVYTSIPDAMRHECEWNEDWKGK